MAAENRPVMKMEKYQYSESDRKSKLNERYRSVRKRKRNEMASAAASAAAAIKRRVMAAAMAAAGSEIMKING